MDDAPEPSMQLLAEAAQNQSPLPDPQTKLILEQDDRSSSLSDPEDRPITEGTDVAQEKSSELSEEEDTEAETERLEESPDKTRQHKKVLLTATDVVSTAASTPSGKADAVTHANDFTHAMDVDSKGDLHSDLLDHTSPISSLEESPDEGSAVETSASSSTRKRKREEDEGDVTDKSLKQAAMQLLANQVGGGAAEDVKDSAEFIVTSASGRKTVPNGEIFVENGEESAPENEDDHQDEEEVEQEDAVESNDEDVDMEDVGAEADASTKNEEIARKKAALDMLGKIENDFALLRDRLFAERTQKLNEELACLESESITHPEYLATVAAIEAQRKERVALARTSFQYKVKALQKKSIAERTYHHSQYMQTVREIRDKSIEKANQEWYQIQRGRRALDQEPVDRTPMSSMKRADLVLHQNSYNLEVSVLSGMAKYVGFPAAPEVTGASQAEMDEDLRKMGISLQQPQRSHVSSSISQFLQQNLAAEKQFSKVTPWANAQHPHHSSNLNGPQPWSVTTGPDSPFTPANQNNAPEHNLPNGSASTIAAPTPLSSDLATSNPRPISRIVSEHYGETPSRPPFRTEREDDPPPERTIGDHLHLHSSPLEKRPPHITASDPTPRILRSPEHRRTGTPGEAAIGPSPGDVGLTPRFASHGKMPAEVKVGMA